MESQPFEFVVAEFVEEELLVSLVALVVEDQQAAEGVENSTFLEVVEDSEVLLQHL